MFCQNCFCFYCVGGPLPHEANSCDSIFSDVTHVVQVVSDGGLAVTHEGNPKVAGRLTNDKHKTMFQVILQKS